MPAATSNLLIPHSMALGEALSVDCLCEATSAPASVKGKPTCYPSIKRLGSLHPIPVRPCGAVRRCAQAMLALQRVDAIQVSGCQQRMGGVEYNVGVYYRSAPRSRIPVHGPFGSHHEVGPRNCQAPSFTLQLAYEDFVQLSRGVCELAHVSHRAVSCPFCRPVVALNSVSPLRPRWNTHWFKSDRQVCEMLTLYLNEMLALVRDAPTGSACLCHAQERVPRLLRDFLRPPGDERESI